MPTKNHPVIPPTEKQRKKSKGTLKEGNLWDHGRLNRPERRAKAKVIWKGNVKKLRTGITSVINKIKNKL